MLQCGGIRGDVVVVEFALPDAVAVSEAYEEYPLRAVVVSEHRGVDALFAAQHFVHHVSAHLLERTCGSVGSGHVEMLVGAIIHIVFAVEFVDLRSPEPSGLGGVVALEGQSCVMPRLEVGRCVTFNAVVGVGAVSIVGVAVEKNVGVG